MHIAGHADQHRQKVHTHMKMYSAKSLILFSCLVYQGKNLSVENFHAYIYTRQIPPVPGFRHSAQTEGMARQGYGQQPL